VLEIKKRTTKRQRLLEKRNARRERADSVDEDIVVDKEDGGRLHVTDSTLHEPSVGKKRTRRELGDGLTSEGLASLHNQMKTLKHRTKGDAVGDASDFRPKKR